MVWFQCEDCGDNLKKPKLANHFRQCSAFKVSCIDCGQVFGQQDVESHTQCISEAEKYGPKGQAKAPNGANTKTKNETKQKPEVDINVGLSERPPWFCSLCNTKTTSKQTLIQHADGKKHRAKARAFHASKQPPTPNDTTETKSFTEKNAKDGVTENKDAGESRDQDSSIVENYNNASEPNKKRKLETSENSDDQHKARSADLGNGQVVEVKGFEKEKGSKKAKRIATEENVEPDLTKKIEWKKLITSALKSNEDGSMKFKKLAKFALKSLKDSGYTEDKKQLSETLEQKINSSSKFIVDGKYVRLAAST